MFLLAVFYRNKALRTPVHYFIVNMVISDLIFPVIALPSLISYRYNDGLWLVDGIIGINMYKFDDVGISSNLIGSLSLANGQRPPSGRWILKQWQA